MTELTGPAGAVARARQAIRLVREGGKTGVAFGGTVTVYLDGAGMNELRAVLMAQDGLEGLRARARMLFDDGVVMVSGDHANLRDEMVNLAETAHADGYSLAVSDLDRTTDWAPVDRLRDQLADYDRDPLAPAGHLLAEAARKLLAELTGEDV